MNAVTTPQIIDHSLVALTKGAAHLANSSLQERLSIAHACVEGIVRIAKSWQEAGCEAKRTQDSKEGRAEELLAGPISSLRYLRLIIKSMQDVQSTGKPQIPGPILSVDGQLRVPVFPTQVMFDSITFRGMSGQTWLEPAVTREKMFGDAPARMTRSKTVKPRIELILGAGNVSSIPVTDALTKIFQDDSAVLLKMNPVNQYLGPLFEDALGPLIKVGWLRIVYGGAAEGEYAINHSEVQGVHITGSADTHEAIVWGCDPAVRRERKSQGNPLLAKPISSELGNVTPWIILPGNYTDKELLSQAETMAASITNNASFNCVATKMIVTCSQWPQRKKFLSLLESVLGQTATRFAYYPGAEQRFSQFSEKAIQAADGRLPWTLRKDVSVEEHPLLFQRESFVCVAGETRIDAGTPEAFLEKAVDLVNTQMTGTLAAELTVPSQFRKKNAKELDRALQAMRYGTIGINLWAGLGFAWMSPPWGGYPGATLEDVQSGIGSVHNTYLLDRPQKTVVQAPLCMSPKPVWFSTHRCPDKVAEKLLSLLSKPTLLRLPGLFAAALRG